MFCRAFLYNLLVLLVALGSQGSKQSAKNDERIIQSMHNLLCTILSPGVHICLPFHHEKDFCDKSELRCNSYALLFCIFFLFLHSIIPPFLNCGLCSSSLGRVVNKPADGGFTALHMASLNCYTDCVQLLLDLSGNISAVTIQDGMTMDIHKDNFLLKYRLETMLEDLA